MKEYTTDFVTSKDGTRIGYRQLGSGAGLILVHGGVMSSQNFMELAKALSKEFTIYIPDRQGRGLSDTRDAHSLAAESEDIEALIQKTNTKNIFGLSSGATITLHTAITFRSLKKIALYEPPIPPINGRTSQRWYTNYENNIVKENFGKAFINIMKGTGDSSLFTFLPAFIMAPLLNVAIKRQSKTINEGEMPLKALIPTFRYDYKIVRESERIIDGCKDLKAEVLLLGGSKSQRYLKMALDKLNSALPKAKRITFSGIGHLAADNSGKPQLVAKELICFFKEDK